MPYIQINDKQFPLRVGEARVGAGPEAHIRVPGLESGGVQAIVDLSADNHVVIRRGTTGAVVKVNGVQIGAEPTPLIHGDKIEVGGAELLYGDDKKGGSTQYISGVNIPELQMMRASAPAKPTSATGGRLVSLVDGREYVIGPTGLSIGREAGCDVVVPSTEVSRRHAEIMSGAGGYVVSDKSANGVFVNGERVQQSQVLGRGDVLRVGNEDFRFYADVAPAQSAPAPGTSGSPPSASPGAAASGPTSLPGAAPATKPAAPVAKSVAPVAKPAAPVAKSAPAAQPAASAQKPAASAPKPASTAPATPSGSASARPPLATLEIINEGLLKGRTFEIRVPLAHVGRGEHNDISIPDESVSDSHAKLQKRDGGWFVVDMDSTNGTYVGGRRIAGEEPLVGRPDVRFGGIKMTFKPAAEAVDDMKGTRAIAGMSVEQAKVRATASKRAREQAQRAPSPATAADAVRADESVKARSLPPWLWIAAAILLAAAAFFLLRAR